ncbi:MAG: hypothetical protein AAFX06_05265 [Planctomycetota bacterium]
MNFLSHALPYLDQPLVAVCTAVPDWLSVIDRKIRARERMVTAVLDQSASPNQGEVIDQDDEALQQVAKGILAHIRDDHWFHGTAAFTETNLQLAVELRDRLPGDRGFRPMFLGHILIEVLLDAFWIRDQPELGERYYELVEACPAETIERCVNQITGKPTDRLVTTIGRFAKSRFLFDYLDDERLLFRLNQVMQRVGLAELPESLLPWIANARELVESRREQFLTPPNGTTNFPPIPRNHD